MQEFYVSLLVLITPSSLGGGVGLSDNQISFSTNTVNGWQGLSGGSRAAVAANENGPLKMESSLGHPLYLHPIEQAGTYIYNSKDELITRSGAPLPSDGNLLRADHSDAETRGAKYTDASLTNAFGVSAVLTNTTNHTSSSYFQNLKATPSGGSWITSEPKYWPTDGPLSFYAYYPYSTDSHSMLSEDTNGDVNKTKTVHYVAATSADGIIQQPDLIVAKHENVTHGSTDAPTSVGLTFSHVLTAITFAVGSDMVPGTVKSISIKGVKNTGDYDLSTGQWTTSGADADFKIDLGNGQGKVVAGKQDEALTTGAQTLMMIPQTFDASSKAKVEIVFTKTGGHEQTLSASLANTSWTEGSTIIYKVSTSSLLPTLTLNNITFPTDWSSRAEYGGKLKSVYQDNDQLGLYVIAADGRVKAANVPVTRQGGKWIFPSGQPHIKVGDKVFAYYPYQQNPQGNLPSKDQVVNDATTLTDANAFFKNLENAWTPQTDQSTIDKMNACDLQVAKAVISNTGSGIDLTMSHAMGLADLTLGRGPAHFQLSKGEEYKFDGTHFACDDIEGRKLYKLAKNHYVAIVIPNKQTEFKPKNAVCLPWKQSSLIFQPTIAEVQKKTAEPVDHDPTIYLYTLEPGDVYYSDGACSHQDDDLEAGKTPIGIVGYIGQNKWTEYQTGSGHGGHALVIALKLGSLIKPTSGDYGTFKITSGDLITKSCNENYGSGYLLTQQERKLSVSTILALNTYTQQCPLDKSTGWFVPTVGQVYAIFSQINGGVKPNDVVLGQYLPGGDKIVKTIDGFIQKAGETTSLLSTNYGFATTSEYSASSILAAWNTSGLAFSVLWANIAVVDGQKGAAEYYVRPFLAF